LALSVIGPDDTACRALEQAAKRSIHRNAFDVASRTFERASLLASTQPCQAQLLCQAAAAAWQAGQGNRTMQLLERAEQRDTSSATMLAAKHLRGHAVSRLGPVSDGLAALIEAANIASQADPERAAIILSEAVNTAFYAGDAEAMRSIANGVATIDARLPEGRARFFATMAQGMALTLSGESRRGAVLLHKASELALRSYREEDDPQWLTWAAMGPIWLRESGPARALVERAAAVARSRAAIGLLPYLICHVAIDQATTNRWAQAEATFHEAIRLSVETHQRTDRAAALARLAWLEARQGTEGRCLDHASEAIALAQRELLGRAKIADVDLSPAPELLELHLRQGETHSAARLAAEYYSSAVEKGLPWALARAARCRALLAIDRQADELFEEALQAHAKTPDAFETGRTYLAYGSKLRRSRRRADARKSLRAAAEIFHDLGANVWSTVASRELAATGVTARKRNETTRYDLTPQELQIALLLASNHSTKQAAAALFLSPKTVEYHLRNIYRKLACNTREDLAAALRSR
jgi:DNA-binding CsgD family transcriptional regulator